MTRHQTASLPRGDAVGLVGQVLVFCTRFALACARHVPVCRRKRTYKQCGLSLKQGQRQQEGLLAAIWL